MQAYLRSHFHVKGGTNGKATGPCCACASMGAVHVPKPLGACNKVSFQVDDTQAYAAIARDLQRDANFCCPGSNLAIQQALR